MKISIQYIETSEGHKVGLVKNLSLTGNVTVMMLSQINIIKTILKDRIINIQDVPIDEIGKYTRVFLNGEWLGLTDKPKPLYRELKNMKYRGEIDIHTCIIHEIKSEVESKELKVYCDGGRLFRPAFRTVDNRLLLNREHINSISLNAKGPTVVTNWNEFLIRYPGVIEFIDVDEQYNAMIAMYPKDVTKMYNRMTNSIDLMKDIKLDKNQLVINRYDDFTFVRYTHCEIHPSMHIGVVVSNIPFCNHNQGPRNIYQYSQARQAMGIYTSNYRDRLDISYVLYHPQRPLVTTRNIKYINTDKLPAGENAVVAIMCYTGYYAPNCQYYGKFICGK